MTSGNKNRIVHISNFLQGAVGRGTNILRSGKQGFLYSGRKGLLEDSLTKTVHRAIAA